jgi:hypothetical protein
VILDFPSELFTASHGRLFRLLGLEAAVTDEKVSNIAHVVLMDRIDAALVRNGRDHSRQSE